MEGEEREGGRLLLPLQGITRISLSFPLPGQWQGKKKGGEEEKRVLLLLSMFVAQYSSVLSSRQYFATPTRAKRGRQGKEEKEKRFLLPFPFFFSSPFPSGFFQQIRDLSDCRYRRRRRRQGRGGGDTAGGKSRLRMTGRHFQKALPPFLPSSSHKLNFEVAIQKRKEEGERELLPINCSN